MRKGRGDASPRQARGGASPRLSPRDGADYDLPICQRKSCVKRTNSEREEKEFSEKDVVKMSDEPCKQKAHHDQARRAS